MHMPTGHWCITFSGMYSQFLSMVKCIEMLLTEDYLPAIQKRELHAKEFHPDCTFDSITSTGFINKTSPTKARKPVQNKHVHTEKIAASGQQSHRSLIQVTTKH